MKRLYSLLMIFAFCVLSGCNNAVPVKAALPPIVLPEPKPVVNISASGQGDVQMDTPEQAPEPAPAPEEEEFFNEPETDPEDIHIIVKKSELTLELYGDDVLIGKFPIRIGESEGQKEKEGDKRTPEGNYYICSRKDETENTLFMGISYPNTEDAKAAYEDERIDRSTRNAIIEAIDGGKRPPWDTPMGGSIGIHGKYDDREFTQGCIAISDDNVRILWEYAQTGTSVEILP